jgi:hypothetical protein
VIEIDGDYEVCLKFTARGYRLLNLNLLKFSNGRLLSNDWQSEKLEIT